MPGGRIDKTDGSIAGAAARELFEETGIDVRQDLQRMQLADLLEVLEALLGASRRLWYQVFLGWHQDRFLRLSYRWHQMNR